MINETTLLHDNVNSLDKKVEFLRHPESYPDATRVAALETHMSWVFLTDQYAYKLKKPVQYDFLDFRTLEARYKYCMEEAIINRPLGGDTYISVVPLKTNDGLLQLNGQGETVEWLVKMKRLPEEQMLHTAIKEDTLRNELVQQAAEMLVDFYLASLPVKTDSQRYRQQIIKDIERNSEELLRDEFNLPDQAIISITTDLLHFVIKHADLFDQRITDGRIVDGHGDLRPEHICLAPHPVIIDRVEFNKELRVMDVAEELSFLALECEMLMSPATGQLFINCYHWKSRDKIPEMLICFYKAKRALLRAKLSIHHLLEKKYLMDEQKWKSRCEAYLQAAAMYCGRLPE